MQAKGAAVASQVILEEVPSATLATLVISTTLATSVISTTLATAAMDTTATAITTATIITTTTDATECQDTLFLFFRNHVNRYSCDLYLQLVRYVHKADEYNYNLNSYQPCVLCIPPY